MIVIRIELWPGGSHERRKTIAVGTIANTGGTEARGEYGARFYGAGNGATRDISHVYEKLARVGRDPREPWRVAYVKGFPRKREGAWALLMLALIEAVAGLRRIG